MEVRQSHPGAHSDAPCHGKEFHDLGRLSDDYWEGGDKLQRNVDVLLTRLRVEARIDTYLFCHLTTYTHGMATRFKELAGNPPCCKHSLLARGCGSSRPYAKAALGGDV